MVPFFVTLFHSFLKVGMTTDLQRATGLYWDGLLEE
jgi:hypothetical protein